MVQLNRKQIVVGGAAITLLLASFALGRYTVPERVRIETKTEYVEKKTDDKQTTTRTDTDKDRHTDTTKTEIKKPDGTTITRTRTKEDVQQNKQTNKDTKEHSTDDVQLTKSSSSDTEKGKSPLTVSGLVGLNITHPDQGLTYGAIVSKPLIGPLTVGVWGLGSGVGGFALGLQF